MMDISIEEDSFWHCVYSYDKEEDGNCRRQNTRPE